MGLQSGQQPSSAFPGTQNFLNNSIGASNYAAQGGLMSPTSNPYLKQYYQAAAQPMISEYEQATAPNIVKDAAQTGTVGGTGHTEATRNANETLSTGLGDLAANIYSPAYGQGLQAAEMAVGGAPNLASGAYIPSQMMQQSGAIGQNQTQNMLNTGYGNLNTQAMWPFTELQQLAGGLGAYPGQGGSKVTVGGGGSMK